MFTFHVMTDFSAAATNALHYAATVAQHVGGKVHLWHVLPEAAGFEARYFGGLRRRRSVTEARYLLDEFMGQLPGSVACAASSIGENPSRQLVASLGSGAGQVVVVGNANPAKCMRTAGSSTALHLVRTLPLPLLVVPLTYRPSGVPRRIMMDTDRRAVRLPATAATIAGLLAELTASSEPLTLTSMPCDVDNLLTRMLPEVAGLHVYTGAVSPEVADVAHRIRQTGLLGDVAHTVTTVRYPCVEEGIRRAATRYRADLLAFVTRQRMFAGPRFLSSVTAGLLAHSRIPVLTLPEAMHP